MNAEIARVREATLPTPHRFAGRSGGEAGAQVRYVDDSQRILADPRVGGDHRLSFELAGPRERIAHDPAAARAAILTSGGLCPGLNDVIRAIVHSLHFHYGLAEERILGVPNGYRGLCDGAPLAPLTLARVHGIHGTGGSILGTARIEPRVDDIVAALAEHRIDLLFCIGGDGTQRGAHAIHEAAARRGLRLSVVGVPKTIDNDIGWVEKTFGFDTAVSLAREAIDCGHIESSSVIGGVGLVKLMGRQSGFIAACAAIAASHPNFVLVPEVPFALAGEHGLFAALERRLARRGHALIVLAEGAGQELMPAAPASFDASGNRKLQDVGAFLRERIHEHLRSRTIEHTMKYLDPSYLIRAAGANAGDAIFCVNLGHHAAHAAMSGRSDLIVGTWNGRFIHVPIGMAVVERKAIDPAGELWRTVLEVTGQGSLA
jgi:6-phosphofructokinase 1